MPSQATILWSWDGEVMRPANGGFAKRADEQFVVGERYVLENREERSSASHRQYFAAIKEAWENLPFEAVERYPSPEALRKWALVKAGYADERTFVCDSPAQANKMARFIRPMDEYAVIVVRGDTVKVYTAQSQSVKAMNRKTFQESKDKVLHVLSEVIGVSVGDLTKNAGMAA